MNLPLILKESTKVQHDHLEKGLNLLREDLSLDEYTGLLKRFYGLYKILEPKLYLPLNRQKISHLEDDLIFFNESLDVETCSKLPPLETESHRMGVRYVLEGSTLGGLVLTKHFKEKFNLSSEKGLSFFSGYGKDTLSMWRSFQDELVIFSQSIAYQKEHVISAAQATFLTFDQWLNESN
jgi:heme oxygenase